MADYYSNSMRDLAKALREDGDELKYCKMIYANMAENAAWRIDELQRQLAAQIEQTARYYDEIQRLKNVQINIEPIVY